MAARTGNVSFFFGLLLAVKGVTRGVNESSKARVWFVVLLVGDMATQTLAC